MKHQILLTFNPVDGHKGGGWVHHTDVETAIDMMVECNVKQHQSTETTFSVDCFIDGYQVFVCEDEHFDTDGTPPDPEALEIPDDLKYMGYYIMTEIMNRTLEAIGVE
jgi:hypothetical protein